MSAELIGSAKIELELDPRRYNSGIDRAAARTKIIQAEVNKIDLKNLERGANNLAGGLQKVISAARLLTAALAVGSIAAALKQGGEEAVRLQNRLDRVRGAFAGLGERLLRERIFGRQAADWAQALANGINSIDASKIARLTELMILMQGAKIGADVVGGAAKVAGALGARAVAGGGGTAAAGALAVSFKALLGPVGLVVAAFGALAIATSVLNRRLVDASRAGMAHTDAGLVAAIRRLESQRGVDTGGAADLGAMAARDRDIGRTPGLSDVVSGSRRAGALAGSLQAQRAAEQQRLRSAQQGVSGAQDALNQARAGGNAAAVDALQSRLDVAQARLQAVTESVTRNLAELDDAIGSTSQFQQGLRTAAQRLFEHAERVQEAEQDFGAGMAALSESFDNAIRALAPSGASVSVAADQWQGHVQRALEDTARKDDQIIRLQGDMVKEQERARREVERVRGELEESNARAEKMEEFFSRVLQP